MSSPITPEDILDYFEHHLSQYQSHELHWRRGAEATRLWIQLMYSSDAMEVDDLTRLLYIITQPNGMSSGWHDLSLRIQHWATTLPPLFQAEAMAAYFTGAGDHGLVRIRWKDGQRIAVAWGELLKRDSVPVSVLDPFVTDAQQKLLFLPYPVGYWVASMIDVWLEGIRPMTTLHILPLDWHS